MDALNKRREARKRRLQQDPEERLRRIRNLKNVSETDNKQETEGTEALPSISMKEESSNFTETLIKAENSETKSAAISPEDAHSASKLDLWTFISGFLIKQFLAMGGANTSTKSSSSKRTIFVCLVALLFRLLLEIDWIIMFTGQSMVTIFVVVYTSWLYLFEKVNIQNGPVIFLVFHTIQDFAVYLFTFSAVHGIISLMSGVGKNSENI